MSILNLAFALAALVCLIIGVVSAVHASYIAAAIFIVIAIVLAFVARGGLIHI